jgi:DNA-binding transcriptional ArsR family regulator
VHPFDVLGDPVRRRILDELTAGERTAGELAAAATAEFGITQPAVSRQLRILRDESFVAVRPDGTRRFYALAAEGIGAADAALAAYRPAWRQRLDALHTEVARGKRAGAVDQSKEKAS